MNAKDCNGTSALFWTAVAGNIEIVSILPEAGAIVNATDDSGYTVLKVAREKDHTEIVELLIEAGAEK